MWKRARLGAEERQRRAGVKYAPANEPGPPLQTGEREHLEAMLRSHSLLADAVDELLPLARREEVAAGTKVVVQGSSSGGCYLVQSGHLDAMRNDVDGVLRSMRPGDLFGEVALVYNTKRTADVIARTSCVLFAIDRAAYHRAIMLARASANVHLDVLQSIPLLSTLTAAELARVAATMVETRFSDGERIFAEGEAMDERSCMFVLTRGTVRVSCSGGDAPGSTPDGRGGGDGVPPDGGALSGLGPQRSRDSISIVATGARAPESLLLAPDFFGEAVLLLAARAPPALRASSAHAVGDATCLALDSRTVTQLLSAEVGRVLRDRVLQHVVSRVPLLQPLLADASGGGGACGDGAGAGASAHSDILMASPNASYGACGGNGCVGSCAIAGSAGSGAPCAGCTVGCARCANGEWPPSPRAPSTPLLLRELCALFEEVTVPVGHVLIRQGEPSHADSALYIILDGRVDITMAAPTLALAPAAAPGPGPTPAPAPTPQRSVTMTRYPTDWFGEVSVLTDKPRTATVTVTGRSTCTLLAVRKRHVLEFAPLISALHRGAQGRVREYARRRETLARAAGTAGAADADGADGADGIAMTPPRTKPAPPASRGAIGRDGAAQSVDAATRHKLAAAGASAHAAAGLSAADGGAAGPHSSTRVAPHDAAAVSFASAAPREQSGAFGSAPCAPSPAANRASAADARSAGQGGAQLATWHEFLSPGLSCCERADGAVRALGSPDAAMTRGVTAALVPHAGLRSTGASPERGTAALQPSAASHPPRVAPALTLRVSVALANNPLVAAAAAAGFDHAALDQFASGELEPNALASLTRSRRCSVAMPSCPTGVSIDAREAAARARELLDSTEAQLLAVHPTALRASAVLGVGSYGRVLLVSAPDGAPEDVPSADDAAEGAAACALAPGGGVGARASARRGDAHNDGFLSARASAESACASTPCGARACASSAPAWASADGAFDCARAGGAAGPQTQRERAPGARRGSAWRAYGALKVIRKGAVLASSNRNHVLNERALMMRARHPNIVRLFRAFHDESCVYFLTELCAGGELFTRLVSAPKGRLCAAVDARFYAACVALALERLGALEIAYRDLKPENLLIDHKGYCKLADFGFARELRAAHGERATTLCGTPEYMAPEMICSPSGYTQSVDWWALGVLVFEMIAGRSPFCAKAPLQVYRNILEANVPPLPPPAAADGGPPSADEVTAHAAASRLVRALLTHRPSHRLGNLDGGAADVKAHEWFAGLDWAALEAGQIEPPWAPALSGLDDTRFFAECIDESVELRIAAWPADGGGDGGTKGGGGSLPAELAAFALEHFAPFGPLVVAPSARASTCPQPMR